MSEIKSLLKEAREAIAAKKYDEAQELCKSILRKDRQNYMGLVLLGVSLQESDKAPLAFHKALEVDRTKHLAWQGLATYYEKYSGADAGVKLISTYKEMLKLDMDTGKISEILIKLGQMGLEMKNAQTINIIEQFLSETSDDALRQTAENQLLELLRSEVSLECEGNYILATIKKFIKTYSEDDKLALNYAKICAKHLKFPSFMDDILNLKSFSSNNLLRGWLCRYIFQEYVSKGTLDGWNLETYEEALTREIDATASSFLKCVLLFERRLYKEAYELGIAQLDSKCLDDILVKFLIKCAMCLSNWTATEKLIGTVISNIKNENTTTELKRALLLSYVRQENWKQGAIVGLELHARSDLSPEDSNLLAQCLIRENHNPDDIINTLQNTKYYDSLLALKHIRNNELNEAKDILEKSDSNTSDKWFLLGLTYWKRNEKDKCLIPFLKAVKLDCGQSTPFLYLGHYYKEYACDVEKAKKCYFQAFSLNSSSSEAARSLSEVYGELGEDEINYKFMQNASRTLDQSDYWPQMQMGLYNLSQRSWDEAIKNFRSVIGAAPGDILAWECLADAYYSRRSFTSALKCYTKVIEMRPNETLYPETQIGTINNILGNHEESLTNFKNVLMNDPKCINAHKGISDTLKMIAEKKLEEHVYHSSREYAQQAVEHIVQAVIISPSFSCLWKALGDALMLITKLPIKYAYAHVPSKLMGDSSEQSVYKMKEDIFPLAISCYSRAIKIATFDSTPHYYGVGVAYWKFYKETGDIEHCQKAFTAMDYCVRNQPNEWNYWNLLGVISSCKDLKRDDFAQYCFLKALACNKDRPEPWTNIGVLYLQHGNHRLANKAFKRAQETDPDYLYSWIGQALIAEAVNEEEAMDLFRHATLLGYHREAALGYADWVCRTLQNSMNKDDPKYKYVIEKMQAIPVALDLMTWVCEYESRNPFASTLLGLLQERSGLLSSATSLYKIALETCTSLANRNIAALNMGRILLRTGVYPEAFQTLQQITEATFVSACSTALALYRTDDYEEAYNAFDTALHWLTNDDKEKADLLVAMAGIIYKFKGPDEAKTVLFQSIKASQTPTAHSLIATCALGLLHSDKGLSKLALNELKRYEKNPEYIYDIGFLKSYLNVQENDFEKALMTMSKSIMIFPDSAKLWYCLAQFCLQEFHSTPESASSCVHRAIELSEGDSEVARMLSVVSMAEQQCGNTECALLLAQKAIHAYPERANNWASLILVMAPKLAGTERNVWLKEVILYSRRRLTLTRPMALWLGLVERMAEKNN